MEIHLSLGVTTLVALMASERLRTTGELDIVPLDRMKIGPPVGRQAAEMQCKVSDWIGRLCRPTLPDAEPSQFYEVLFPILHSSPPEP